MIQPVKTLIDGIRFDSVFESTVYVKLNLLSCVKAISVQHKLLIKPSTRNYKALHWTIDFRLEVNTDVVYVEAKGFKDKALSKNLQYLDCVSPEDYSKLILVYPDNFDDRDYRRYKNKFKNLKVCRLSELKDAILRP